MGNGGSEVGVGDGGDDDEHTLGFLRRSVDERRLCCARALRGLRDLSLAEGAGTLNAKLYSSGPDAVIGDRRWLIVVVCVALVAGRRPGYVLMPTYSGEQKEWTP